MAETRNERIGTNEAKPPARKDGRTDQEQRVRPQMEIDRPRRGGPGLRNDPFTLMNALRQQVDRIFDDFGFGGSLFRSPLAGGLERGFGDLDRGWSPQVELYEHEGKLHVTADLPGLTKDDVHVELLDDHLTIEGERKSERRDEKGSWSERSYGGFFRSIPLPEGIQSDSATATFQNGVLHITLDAPQRRETRGRRIEIQENTRK